MATHKKAAFVSLTEERFDFDLPLSPASESGDADEEDEVFIGPVGHKEKCISVGIEKKRTNLSSGSSGPLLGLELGSWSPLTGDKFEQITQEAHLLAQQIGENGGDEPAKSGSATTTAVERTELFAEDPGAKLSALGPQPGPAVSPIKRETFCVRDSPLKQLPPAIQQRLLKAGGANSPGGDRAQAGRGNCSPLRASQPKAALRGRVGLSCGRGVLPNRPALPGVGQRSKTRPPPPAKKGALALSSAGSSEDLLSDVSMDSLNTSLPERKVHPGTRKMGQPPAFKPVAMPGLRKPDRRKNTSSSSSSVSSLNSSVSVSPSGKGALNTSLCSGTSGAKLKATSGVSRLPGSGAAASSKLRASSMGGGVPAAARAARQTPSAQVKRPADTAKSNPAKKREPAPPNLTPARRSIQRAGSVPNVSAAAPPIVAKGTTPKPAAFVAPTPSSRAKGPRRSEVPSPDTSRISKPKKPLSASSTESLLQKAAVTAPEGLQTPTVGGKSVSALPRRSLALPTPVNRRISGIPMMTPKSKRPGQAGERPGLPVSARKISQGSPVHLKVIQRPSGLDPEAFPREDGSCGATLQPGSLAFSLEDESESGDVPNAVSPGPGTPKPTSGHSAQICRIPDQGKENRSAPESSTEIQKSTESSLETQNTPDSSLASQDPSESTSESQNIAESSSEGPETSESSIEKQEALESSRESQNAPKSCTENRTTPEFNKENENSSTHQQVQRPHTDVVKTPKNKEALLVDAPAPVLKPEERLLIDLSNTPDLIKTAPLKPSGGQLIDLSSPLITWSPIDKKGNAVDSPPLINLSF